jgi:hypothetical protein
VIKEVRLETNAQRRAFIPAGSSVAREQHPQSEEEDLAMCTYNKQWSRWLSTSLTVTVALAWLTGCASTKQPSRSAPLGKTVRDAGFLGDLYPLMREGVKAGLVLLKNASTGKPPFAGEITVEGKFNDAQTGEVIAAAVDRRVGARKPIIGIFQGATYDSWNDVDEAMRYWAERLRYRLCQRRDGANCVAPKA